MDKASSVTFPRSAGLHPEDTERYELHVFCDASQLAYGAVAYLRKIGNNEASSDIVFNKTQVAPLKAITIPRLELLAALLGARVIKFLKGQLPVHRICLHSYSSCVLGWIQSKKTQPAFVEKRLAEIRENPRLSSSLMLPAGN